jgi:hypothetical protein
VWPENWPAVQAFLTVQTQWVVGMSGPTGLDYARVRDGLTMAGIEVSPALFQSLRVIELGVLEALASANEKRTKRSK